MSNIKTMREWYAQAIKTNYHNVSVTAVDAEEFFELHTSAGKAIKANGSVRVSGIGNIRENGFEVRLNGGVFRINPPATKKKGVAETSREAYHSLDISASVETVAKAAIALAKDKPSFTDVELASHMNMQPAIISARRNDIEKAGVVIIDKTPYKLQAMGRKANPSGKTANAWRLVVDGQTAELF